MSQLVLVTGGTGFVGSHVIAQLLGEGYHVRATARSPSRLQSIFPNEPSLEVVEMPTLVSDYSEFLKGVGAVVHIAAQVLKGTSDETLNAAYDGTLHIMNQSIDAGIKKIVVTGSYVSLFDSTFKLAFGKELITEEYFDPVTFDSLDRTQNKVAMYQSGKSLAEKKVWELAKEHSDVDFTVLLPSVIFGPFIPHYHGSNSSDLFDSIGSNAHLCNIYTTGTGAYPDFFLGHAIDVRDLARAHVAALSAPPIPGRNKRFIISSSTFNWKDVADLLRRERPELTDRLPKADAIPTAMTDAPLNTSFAEEVLGMKEYVPWEETALAAIDTGLAWEKRRKDI